MTALDAFTRYLAQAHGCSALAAAPARSGPLELELQGVGGDADPAPSARAGSQLLATEDLAHAVVACSVGAPLGAGGERLDLLRRSLAAAPAGVVVFDATEDAGRGGLEPVRRALGERRLAAAFLGRAPQPTPAAGARPVLAVLDEEAARWDDDPPPDDFRVLAIVPARNEADVIAQTLRDLIGQGLEVHLLDNWSTDDTARIARAFLGRGLVALERFPPSGPSPTYDLRPLLRRVEEVAAAHREASWVVLHDADERRRPPWPDLTLREALWRVDRSGYTCVDHVTLNFWPTDDAFDPDGPDLEAHFPYFEFSRHPGHFHQRRAWKQPGGRVALARSAGHDVQFRGRRVYPYKFLLKHYPFRSRAHAEAKLRDRTRRWNPEERALGWHRQYDDAAAAGPRARPALLRFDPATFHEEYLVERLSGAGVFARPPPWATPPAW